MATLRRKRGADRLMKQRASTARNLEALRATERKLWDRRNDLRNKMMEARDKLPVWEKGTKSEPAKEVVAYARGKLEWDKEMAFGGRVGLYDNAASLLDHIAVHYFFLDMVGWELEVARATLKAAETGGEDQQKLDCDEGLQDRQAREA